MHDPMVVAFDIRRLVTVWHVEPGGRDSGEVCKHHKDGQRSDAWRWHFWHWKIQILPLQRLRRRLLTRCAWCDGRSMKHDPVNVSHSWDAPRAPWWRGEVGLYHADCSTVSTAWNTCTCPDPLFDHNGYGECQFCHRRRAWNKGVDERANRVRELIPHGGRDKRAYKAIYRVTETKEDDQR